MLGYKVLLLLLACCVIKPTDAISCYVCDKCDAIGVVQNCSDEYWNGNFCDITQESDGSIYRDCGFEEHFELVISLGIPVYDSSLGCYDLYGDIVCKCETQLCNSYLDIFTTTPAASTSHTNKQTMQRPTESSVETLSIHSLEIWRRQTSTMSSAVSSYNFRCFSLLVVVLTSIEMIA
ncbi:uncharacterized protein [Watersipora subatra]|uniref:uncharacterized protein n=1 Tax=Watersipora subatra TaxID=2589382 RepID=UPI00355C6D07